MSVVLGTVRPYSRRLGQRPIHRAQCRCGRVYQTSSNKAEIRRNEYCNACKPGGSRR